MKLKLLLFALLALIVANCTLGDPAVPTENEINEVTVSVTLSPETRVLYDDSQVGSTPGALSWQTGDQLMLIGFNDSDVYQGQRTFTYSGSGNSFTYTGQMPANATKYKAFYPASAVQLDANGDPVLVNGNPPIPGSTFWVQTQSGTGSLTHLSDKLLLSDTDANALTTPFNMLAISSILKFNLSGIPNDLGTLTKLIWQVQSTTVGYIRSAALSLTNIPVNPTNLIAYLAFDPDLMDIATNGQFKVTLIGSDKSYEWSITSTYGKDYVAGTRYTANVSTGWVTAKADFRFTVNTNNTKYEIKLKNATVTVPANLTIYWGDGTHQSVAKGASITNGILATKTISGIRTITISSDQADPSLIQIPQLIFNGNNHITAVLDPFPNMNASDFSSCFLGCQNLASIPPGLFQNNRLANNFTSAFNQCKSLQIIEALFPNPTDRPNFFSGRGQFVWTGCFFKAGSGVATQGVAPKLWLFNYDSVVSTDCFKNANVSNIAIVPSNWGGNGPVYP